MLSYDGIKSFIKNIFYANGKKFDEEYLSMWIREIINTGADIGTINKAETEIIRNNVPLRIYDVCDVIRKNKPTLILPPTTDCKYCNGRGYVIGIKFDHNRIYTGYEAALNCICGNLNMPNMTTMKPNPSNNHKTECRDGYYRIFPSIVEKHDYLDKVEKNNWRDIR